MAHFCPDCKITFESRVSNCPRCGYGIVNDTQPESYYTNQGYTRFSHFKRTTSTTHIKDDDILSSLRSRFNTYVNNNGTKANTTSTATQPIPEPQPSDFFASFADSQVRTPEVNIQHEPETESTDTPTTSHPSRTNIYRTPSRRFGRFDLGRGVSQIPWRAIIYFAIFVAVIAIVVNIWNMRFEILDSVMSFVGSLMPLALLIIGIIYLFRRIIR